MLGGIRQIMQMLSGPLLFIRRHRESELTQSFHVLTRAKQNPMIGINFHGTSQSSQEEGLEFKGRVT